MQPDDCHFLLANIFPKFDVIIAVEQYKFHPFISRKEMIRIESEKQIGYKKLCMGQTKKSLYLLAHSQYLLVTTVTYVQIYVP